MLYEQYSVIVCSAISSICRHQGARIMTAAELAAKVIINDGLIYLFGCGHSGILSAEGFYRAGGLACVAPIFDEPMMLHESAVLSSRLEKKSGYFQNFLSKYYFESRDMLICFSTSGGNAVPVELAKAVVDSGVPTVAVCSSAYFSQPAHNAAGKHLHEVCTMYIDNCAPFGDTCLQPCGASAQTTPLSTITGAFILNSILAEAAQLAGKCGANVPIYTSGNVPGGPEHNEGLIHRYAGRIPFLMGDCNEG